MNIQHEITAFSPVTGSMLVRYFSEEVPDGLVYNIDIPIVDGAYVGQTEIDALVEAMTPVGQLERIAKLKQAPIPPALAALIPPEPTLSSDAAEEAV